MDISDLQPAVLAAVLDQLMKIERQLFAALEEMLHELG